MEPVTMVSHSFYSKKFSQFMYVTCGLGRARVGQALLLTPTLPIRVLLL